MMSMRDPPDGDGWNEDPSNEDPSGSIGIHRMRMAHDGHDGWPMMSMRDSAYCMMDGSCCVHQ